MQALKRNQGVKTGEVGFLSEFKPMLNQESYLRIFVSFLGSHRKGGGFMKLVLDLKTFFVELKLVFENTFRKKSIR
jgi:hypothetical protein